MQYQFTLNNGSIGTDPNVIFTIDAATKEDAIIKFKEWKASNEAYYFEEFIKIREQAIVGVKKKDYKNKELHLLIAKYMEIGTAYNFGYKLRELTKKLESITSLELTDIRELALNKDFSNIINSNKEFSEETINGILNQIHTDKKELVKEHLNRLNWCIKSHMIIDIRKNPIEKPTPLSAFDWVGHNETDVKLPKNSVQVNYF